MPEWQAPPGRPLGGREFGTVGVEQLILDLCEEYLTGEGLELDDLDVAGRGRRIIRVTVDSAAGVNVDQLAAASRELSRRLDRLDPFDDPYSLEVTSPGLERALRRPLHFHKSIGRDVTVKTSEEVGGSRHHRGVIEAVDEDGFLVRIDGAARHISFGQVSSARTRFEWKKQPKSARKSG